MAVRGDRVILVEEDVEGRVPGVVAITPDFAVAYRKVRAGVALVHTWDGTSILSKCMWSVETLTTDDLVDGETSTKDGLELDRQWMQEFSATNVLLPAVDDPVGDNAA